MADPDFIRLLFGDPKKTPEEQEIIPPVPVIPPLPDIQALLSRVRRQVDKAKTLEVKTDYIDIGIAELKQIKDRGERQYHTLTEQNALDDPQPFLDYSSDLDEATNELCILRMSLLVEDADRATSASPMLPSLSPVSAQAPLPAPGIAPGIAPSVAPVLVVPASVIPTTPDPAAPVAASPVKDSAILAEQTVIIPDVMDIELLAIFLTGSEKATSWFEKHYKEERIPYFNVGRLVKFRKGEVIAWCVENGKYGYGQKNVSSSISRLAESIVPASPKNPLNGFKRVDNMGTTIDSFKQSFGQELVQRLIKKEYIESQDCSNVHNWIESNANRKNIKEIIWRSNRKSLASFIILCQHTDIIHMPSNGKSSGDRPDYTAMTMREFRVLKKETSEIISDGIDRDWFQPVEIEATFFEKRINAWINDEPGPSEKFENPMLCALEEYFGEMEGSEGFIEREQFIKKKCKKIDFQIMRLFYDSCKK